MTTADKIKRGEAILREYEKLCDEHDDDMDYPGVSHAAAILHAISGTTHEVQIPRKKMCIALAEAEFEDKTVKVVPDKDCMYRDDGWTYHIEIV